MSDTPDTPQLSEEEYYVCILKGTEPPFSGEYTHHKAPGIYHCKCCAAALFTSDTKFDSGSGWPSFFQPVSATAVAEHRDTTHGMIRLEITCAACGAHLGHVFPDGPPPTGQRYCVNSLSLRFEATTP